MFEHTHCSRSGELLQIILNLTGVVGSCDIHKFQKPWFERQLPEDFLCLLAVRAGGLDEHDHLPRLDLAVHKLLSHTDRVQLPLEDRSVEGVGRV